MARLSSVASGQVETVTVAVAGTSTNPTSRPAPDGVEIVVLAHPNNTDYIKVAFTAAAAEAGVGVNNVPLAANQSISYVLTNPSILFIDAAVSGERAVITYEF